MRWHIGKAKRVSEPVVELFISELVTLCKKHNLIIQHEDTYGAFVIEALNKDGLNWLTDASIGKTVDDSNATQTPTR